MYDISVVVSKTFVFPPPGAVSAKEKPKLPRLQSQQRPLFQKVAWAQNMHAYIFRGAEVIG